MVMRRALLILWALIAALRSTPASGQELRLFGQSGTEAGFEDPNGSSPLNPGNILHIPRSTDTSDLTLFGDVTGGGKRWKLQMKLRGSSDWIGDSSYKFDVSELTFKYAAASWLDVHVGREIERWGTGYAWNPTGVVNPRKDPSDPGDRRSAFRGVDLVSADIFVKGWDVTLLGTPEIAWTGKNGRRLLSTGWAARAYRLIKGADVALTASGGNGLPNSEGLSLARVFGKSLELHGEAAYISDSIRYLPRAQGLAPVRRPHAEILVGGQYTFPGNVNVVGEIYHSGQGLNDRDWNAFGGFTRSAQQSFAEGNPLPLQLANTRFTPLQMSQNYTFLRVLWPIRLNRLELETIVISSLRDGSSLIRPGITRRISTNWSVYCIYSQFVGGAGTEFGFVQIRRGADIGIRYHFSLGAAHKL
jgi:hypothetical protein